MSTIVLKKVQSCEINISLIYKLLVSTKTAIPVNKRENITCSFVKNELKMRLNETR